MPLDVTWALDWARRATKLTAENRVELAEPDRATGGADHSDNLECDMKAAVSRLDAAQQTRDVPASPEGTLKSVTIILMVTVGSTGGPLLGTAFLKAACSCEAAT